MNRDDDNTRTNVVLTQGTMVSHYRIVDRIGAGGMGEVYLAEDTKLKRRVALKFMPAHLASDDDTRARFTREAQAAAKLDHPNIVPVYEVGEFRGRPFFAMAHIEGKPLRDVVKKGKLTVSESIALAMQICEGLQKAHEAGVVHRDIKPSNIIIDNSNRARLLDFGLATVTGEEKLTKTGSTLGTVGYMAPEQIVSKRVDKRADLFSVGVILYEMITGRRPFEGDNDAAVVRAIIDSTPEPIARFKSGVTGELQQIVGKALAKDPSLRYQHADGLLADLKRLSVEPSDSKKSRAALWAAAAAIIVAGGYFGQNLLKEPQEEIQATPPVLVVLPFENLGSAEDEYFSVGIRDEIGARLSTVRGLRVISPRSADKYRGFDKSIEQIGRETGADYVLEATIRWDKSGNVNRFRITPKLTKTSDSYLMWADNYEQNLVQVFAVQTEIAEQIVTALGLTLLEPGREAPDYAPTSNMQAYNYYLRGLDLRGQGIFLANLREAISMFDSAIALDPSFAQAWAKKANAHTEYEFGYIIGDNIQDANAAREAAERALQLDPRLPDAHIALGWYYNLIERDYDKALEEFALAQSEVAANADLSEAIGHVKMRQGKWREALEHFEKAARVDPLTVRRYYWLATCHSLMGELDKAGQYIDRGLVLAPADGDAVAFRVFINLMQHGSVDSPERSFESIVSQMGIARASSYEFAPSHTLGLWRYIIDRVNPDEMIADLRAIREERSPSINLLNIAQIFDLTGQKDSARLYYDSSKTILSKYVETGSDDFHVYSPLGFTYAFLGMADSAIWAGKRGKELMSVDDCHW